MGIFDQRVRPNFSTDSKITPRMERGFRLGFDFMELYIDLKTTIIFEHHENLFISGAVSNDME